MRQTIQPSYTAANSAHSPHDPAAWTIHIDGSAFPNPGRMSVGVVMHGPLGEHFTLSKDVKRVGCNNEAEVLALLAAMSLMAAEHVLQARIYSDSSILVEQLSTPHPKPIARLAALYTQAREQLQQWSGVSLQWVPRHRNQEADALARSALLPPS